MNVRSSTPYSSRKVGTIQAPTGRWLSEQNTVECHSAVKRNEGLTHAAPWTNLENITLSERSQTQKDHVSFGSLYMQCPNSANPQMQEADSLLPGCGRRTMESAFSKGGLSLWGQDCSGSRRWPWLYNTVNVLNATGLYALKWWILSYVKFITV